MTATIHTLGHMPTASMARRILYIGSAANEFCEYFYKHIGDVDFVYKEQVYDAFLAARSQKFDAVVVDQRGDKLATKLVLPVLRSLPAAPSIVVVCAPQDVSQYLAVPGVARVVASPVKQAQLLAALGLQNTKNAPPPETSRDLKDQNGPVANVAAEPGSSASPVVKPAPSRTATGLRSLRLPVLNIGFLTNIISALYKRAAFVLLASLFASFCFYGVLIVFFLFSSSWAAPITLAKGHELVLKAEAQLAQLRVDLNTTEQKIAEARLESDSATRSAEAAKLMMDYTSDTIAKNLKSLQRRVETSNSETKRLAELLALFKNQLSEGGMQADLKRLYKSRLIDKKAFNSSALGLLDATQRLRQLEGQLEVQRDQDAEITISIAMLQGLSERLKGRASGPISAASQEYLQLAKQAFDSRGTYDSAVAELAIAKSKLTVLANSRAIIEQHTSELEAAPPARAISQRVDVLFVPYGNEENMREGASLYTCSFTIFWCSKAGTVGARVPGESAGVHPFFGKPIRGFFVEVNLTDEHAATREIMHAGRPPFFF